MDNKNTSQPQSEDITELANKCLETWSDKEDSIRSRNDQLFVEQEESNAHPIKMIRDWNHTSQILKSSLNHLKQMSHGFGSLNLNKIFTSRVFIILRGMKNIIRKDSISRDEMSHLGNLIHEFGSLVLVQSFAKHSRQIETIDSTRIALENHKRGAEATSTKISKGLQDATNSKILFDEAVENVKKTDSELQKMARDANIILPEMTSKVINEYFEDRGKDLEDKKNFWLKLLFSATVVSFLFFIGFFIAWEIVHPSGTPLLHSLLVKSTTITPFILLLLFFAKNYRQASRAEEFYAFKAVAVKAFLGYRKIFEDLDKNSDNPQNRQITFEFSKMMINTITSSPPYYGDKPPKDSMEIDSALLNSLFEKYFTRR